MERHGIPVSIACSIACLALMLAACTGGDENKVPVLDHAAKTRIAMGKSSNAELQHAESCTALEGELKALAAAEILTWFEQGYGGGVAIDAPTAADGNGGNDSAGSEGAAQYTNNQVAGIDEADFVKTDGDHLFVLQGSTLSRFAIPAPGEILAAGTQAIEGFPRALLMRDDRLLIISGDNLDYGSGGSGDSAMTDTSSALPQVVKITVLEWPAGQPASVLAERWFDGGYLAGRLLENNAHIVLHGQLPNPVLQNLWQYTDEYDDSAAASNAALEDLADLDIQDLLPQSYVQDETGALVPVAYTDDDCAAFQVPADSNGSGVSTILSLDLLAPDTVEARHIVSNYPVVYMSQQHLYLAEGAQDWWWFAWNDDSDERLNVHAFRLDADRVEYLDSVRTVGAPINQFALDEHENRLRIATWTGGTRWWWSNEQIESQLHTFTIDSSGLEPLGSLNEIAPGEQLFAARFVGDTAYLVTFEQIDPLFVIDLSDASNPAILGELEVPGFSTYLHPLSGDRLLAVGVGGNDVNWNAVVSLFDVSDPTSPSLAARHDFAYENGDWNWTEAMYEHKAFQYHREHGLLAIPMGASRNDNGVWQWISTLELVKVEGNALTGVGSIDHSTYFSSTDAEYEYHGSPNIRRSFFIGDFIYAISAKAITVHAVNAPAVIVADALVTD